MPGQVAAQLLVQVGADVQSALGGLQKVSDALGAASRSATAAKSPVDRVLDSLNQTQRGGEEARGVLDRLNGALDSLTGSSRTADGALGTLGRTLALGFGIGTGIAALQAFGSAITGVISGAISMDAQLEQTTLQFTTLMGSADQARQHVADLYQFAKVTPFEAGPVIEASRLMETFGGAALDTKDNLQLLGDAAAATGAPLQEVSFWTSRMYAELQAGKPIGEATRWLQMLAVISPQATEQMDALSKAGASADDIWKAFTQDLGRFGGAMDLQQHTMQGLASTALDTFHILAGEAFKPAFAAAKTALEGIVNALNSEGAERAAQAIAGSVRVTVAAVQGAFDPFVRLGEIITGDTDALLKNAGAWDQAAAHAKAASDQAHAAAASWTDVKQASQDAVAAQQKLAAQFDTTVGGMVKFHDQSVLAADSAANLATAQDRANVALRDAEASADGASRGYDSLRASASAARDEMTRATAQQPILDQQRKAAHDAESAALLAQGQALAHYGDVVDIVNKEEVSAREWAAQQAIDAAKKAQQATEQAARDAAQVQAEQAREAAAIVQRAYLETADEAEAAYARVANAATLPTDNLQQQLDEATNRQVRAGTAGTAAAEKELDAIRRRALSTLPDLAAQNRQYAAAQDRAHAADVAVAGAERDLAIALNESGGQQTLQTAALSHIVTQRRDDAAAAKAQADAIGQTVSQTQAETGALQGLGKTAQSAGTALAATKTVLVDVGSAFGSLSPASAAAVAATNAMTFATSRLQGALTLLQDRLAVVQDRMTGVQDRMQGIDLSGQLADLNTSAETLPLRQQLLARQGQMDLLRLAREATTNKGRQKDLDKEIAAAQLQMDSVETQIAIKQREAQARQLDAEQRTIPLQRERLLLEQQILDIKERELPVQTSLDEMALSIETARNMPGGAFGLPPGWRQNANGTLTPPVINVTVSGNVYGVDNFRQMVVDTVQQADRSGGLNLTRYAQR